MMTKAQQAMLVLDALFEKKTINESQYAILNSALEIARQHEEEAEFESLGYRLETLTSSPFAEEEEEEEDELLGMWKKSDFMGGETDN